MARSKKDTAAEPGYVPTEEELAAVRKFAKQQTASPRMRVTKDANAPKMMPDHPDLAVGTALIGQALGTADADFLNGILTQLASASGPGRELNETELGFMLSLVKGVKPKDEVESMLAAQMAAVHSATMRYARILNTGETIAHLDHAERTLNKLARTFATQMEALKRYRTGGEQKVTVQHVSVSEGGQAIVGNVTQAPRENAPERATPAALTYSPGTPVPIVAKNDKRVRARRPQEE